MERKVTVVSTKTQSKKVFNSSAITLEDLKREMDSNNIDYTNMDFYEGVSRTKFIDDASVLPTNIPYKGQVTNDLVIRLTTTDKKISSGAMSNERESAYNWIKSHNLEDRVKSVFGRNFTQITTSELITFIDNENKDIEEVATKETKKDNVNISSESMVKNLKDLLHDLLEVIDSNTCMIRDDYERLYSKINFLDTEETTPNIESPYSDDEIEEMF